MDNKQQQDNKDLQLIKENICEIIQDNDIERFIQYTEPNEIDINHLSYENDTSEFDILIYSIQNNVSIELVKAILPLYKNKTLNYIQNNWSPLIAAILNNKFEIADLLLENNADMENGYGKTNIFQYMLSIYILKQKLNEENMKYIMDKLYEKNIIPIKITSYFAIKDNDMDYYKIIFSHSIEKVKKNLIEKKTLFDLYKNVLQIITSYDNFCVDIPYNKIVEMSTLSLLNNCNDREDEENEIFDIFWEVYLKIVRYYGPRTILNNVDNKFNLVKTEVVDKYIEDITLKNKFHRYIDDKFIPKEKQLIRKNKIELIKRLDLQYFYYIVPKLVKEVTESFDLLIIAIENNISNIIIIKIMEEYIHAQKSFNYFIDKEYYNDGYSFEKNTPLFTAVAKNNFEIASYLLRTDAITYSNINIIRYLYLEKSLNPENLQYILSRKLVDDDKKERDYIIKKWIQESENVFLELYIKGFLIENNIEIEYDYYRKALDFGNYNAVFILFNYDKNGDYNVFKLIPRGIRVIELLSKCKVKNNFKDENFYNSKFTNEVNSQESKNENKDITETTEKCIDNYYKIDTGYYEYLFNNELFISKLRKDRTLYMNESTYESIKSKIIELNELYKSWKPEKDLPKPENTEEFKEYIIKNKEIIMKFNKVAYNFDLLIYSIENKYPLEIIKFIIQNFHYKSFDYGLEGQITYRKIPKYKTPLFVAILKLNFDLIEYLLDEGATLNRVNTAKFIMNDSSFSVNLMTNLMIDLYLNGYNVSEKEDSYYIINSLIERDNKYTLEMYINYYNIKNIRREYYYMAMEKLNSDAIIILYRYDKGPKEKILEKIFDIFNKNFKDDKDLKNSLLDSEREFQKERFYYCLFDMIKNTEYYDLLKNDLFIDKEKYVALRKEISEFFKKKLTIVKKKLIFFDHYEIFNNLEAFKKYFKDQEIKLNEFNDPYFDILIFLIERIGTANEIIEYVIDQYRENHVDFNYYIEFDYTNDDSVYHYNHQKCKEIYYKTPLICAVIENKYSIADLLIKNGANINFNIDTMEPYFTMTGSSINTKQQINYFIDNKYNMPKKLIKWCIKKNLDPSFIDIIFHKYYDNNFIIQLIHISKNQIALSDIQLEKKVVLDNDICNFVINESYYNSYVIRLFKYEDKVNYKRKLIMYNKKHQYKNEYYCNADDNRRYWDDYDDESVPKHECEYYDGYNEYDYILKMDW